MTWRTGEGYVVILTVNSLPGWVERSKKLLSYHNVAFFFFLWAFIKFSLSSH